MARTKSSPLEVAPPYLSPSELAERWRCSRSSVDRIARRAGIARVYLGEGRTGMVRYDRKEVEAYEAERRVKPVA